MELAEVEKSPKGSGAGRADRRRAHLASGVGRPRTRLEEINSRAARHELQQRINLRKDARAGRAGAASLPRGETFPLQQAPAKRRPASERYGEHADQHGASGGARGELCSPPLHSRRGKSTDEAEKGRTQARSMWSERRLRA